MEASEATAARRPLKSRGSATVRRAAAALARRRVAPNAISVASILFAALAAAALAGTTAAGTDWPLLLGAAAAIQLRLLCNLLDGLVAVEGGLASPDGELYNEVPDRIADALILVAAGYAAGVAELGWAAALAAALTAYVRMLGGALGQPQDFGGPMAKPQRMALMTAACALAIAETSVLAAALGLVTAGALATSAVRLARIRARLLP